MTRTSIASPSRARAGACTSPTRTSSPVAEGRVTLAISMPEAAAAAAALVRSPFVSWPSEISTSRRVRPSGKRVEPRRTAPARSVRPVAGRERSGASAGSSLTERSTSALSPKTTMPAASPRGMRASASLMKSRAAPGGLPPTLSEASTR